MWIIELAFTPAPERLAARPAHRDRLTALHGQGVVRMAGPLADDTGAVIVLDAPGRAAVEAILAADPYFTTPGVSVERIRDWRAFLA
ncbi:YciI family protein [Micromonospora sp. WMMC241]|uniref:YciI family protein n=1 Tax=Micromonospora sp. WMMC241 TaxID=3015159 RepID=UPI0022B5F3CC|nr:YciI family protein [Micromonospora sp. WMMC241]MCZ7436415.1 YciI family protein [Micromonospora sp. WMMC241]